MAWLIAYHEALSQAINAEVSKQNALVDGRALGEIGSVLNGLFYFVCVRLFLSLSLVLPLLTFVQEEETLRQRLRRQSVEKRKSPGAGKVQQPRLVESRVPTHFFPMIFPGLFQNI